MESGDRSFTVTLIKKAGKKVKSDGGRYISKTPDSAARKAFSQYYRQHKKAGRLSLEIHIKETTQNSYKKDFKYRVSKVNDPIDISRGKEIIHYEYTTKVKAL
jgi:hypothetical protein